MSVTTGSAVVDSANRQIAVPRQQKKKETTNPLQAGILSFNAQNGHQGESSLNVDALPKRFTVYSPLLLLPANFPSHSAAWKQYYSILDQEQKQKLYRAIADSLTAKGKPVTHIAINAPISPSENVLRSPSNLAPVYGDFGPHEPIDTQSTAPSRVDFDAAFWVSATQSAGINQVWAPRWTMFSRGNLREKNRILRQDDRPFPGICGAELGHPLQEADVLDMYVGIGYFAFSYLKCGARRVWGWDLNPWSIEGLRRGAEMNGWRCIVVRVDDGGFLVDTSVNELMTSLADTAVRCVAFLGDNMWAAKVMEGIQAELQAQRGLCSIRHANLGLLPSSHGSWKNAVKLMSGSGGCLHVHENVGFYEIADKGDEIVQRIKALLAETRMGEWKAECQHIEQVKTYAPGVVHCVFDIRAAPSYL